MAIERLTTAPPQAQRGWSFGGALVLLVVALVVRFHPAVFSPSPLGDELAQAKAARQLAAGTSPYAAGSYVYPPSLLRLDAWLAQLPVETPFLLLRLATLCGLALLLWGAVQAFALRPSVRWLLALLYGALAPGVVQGVEFGNLSFLVGGLIFAGLLLWPRSALAGGLLLGASLLVKPLAPAVIVALFCHRPAHGRRHLLAAVIAGVVAAVPLLLDPEFGAFLAHGSDSWVVHRTASLHRLLALSGAPQAAPLLSLLLLGLVALCAHRYVKTLPDLIAIASAGAVMVTPVVWNHTLVLTLPLQAMAMALAVRQYRGTAKADRRQHLWELVGVTLAVAALTFGEGVTGIDDRGWALQLFALAPPALAPAALAAYWLRAPSTTAGELFAPARKSS